MKIQLLFACVLAVSANGVAYAQSSLNCDAQVIFNCQSKCERSEAAAAQLTLNFDQKVGTFCRGEQCDDGKINFLDEMGKLNEDRYRIFTLQGSHKFSVSGVLDKNGNLFVNSDIGYFVGTCK